MSEEICGYCNKKIEDCCCVEGIDYHKCLYCREKEFKDGEGFDKKNYYCSEKCYEAAKNEGWME
jgi:hypothetical protein